MSSKRALLVAAIVCAFLLVHEGVFAQRSGGRGKKSESTGKRSESTEKKSESKASSGSSSVSSRRTFSGSSGSRASGSNRSSRDSGGRITRDRPPSRGWNDRDSGRRDNSGGRIIRRVREPDDRDSSRDPVWRNDANVGSRDRRGINDKRRIKRDRINREGRRRDDPDDNRGTIIDRPARRRIPPTPLPAMDCLDYDHRDIIIEHHYWFTNYIEIRFYPIYLPIGVLIPETIDPYFIAKVDSLVSYGFGDEWLVCILQMAEPLQGYELYDVFEGLDDLVVLRKLNERTFIIRAWAESIYEIMDHPLVTWIDEYWSAYKYQPDEWESYQYTYIHLMGDGHPDFVRELAKMGIPLVRTPDPYASCYCVHVGSERVPEIADLWWVYEITPYE